jgi:prepilin-type N-terminal cleavage/methylation domain-containing protein
MKRNNSKGQMGFTLVELLVVIAIIGILAGLVLWLMPGINDAQKRKAVHAQLEQLTMLIEQYKEVKGYYPPENTVDPGASPMFYELTGTTYKTVPESTLMKTLLNAEGIINSTNAIPNPKNFFPNIKNQYININQNTNPPNDVPIYVLAVKVRSPQGQDYCRWNYRISPPNELHNPNGFDLWVEVQLNKGATVIGNWKDKE